MSDGSESKIDPMAEMAWNLRLQTAQTDAALRELEAISAPLSKSFTALAARIGVAVTRPAEANRIQGDLANCVRAMQRHDVLRQRLRNLRDGLRVIETALAQGDFARSSEASAVLRERLRDSYSLADERRVFDALTHGHDPADAAGTDTELF